MLAAMRASSAGSASMERSRTVIACGRRSRSPGLSVPETSPAPRACSIAADSACANVLVQLDGRRRWIAHLNGDADFDAPAREPLLKQRPQSRLDIAEGVRHPQLQIEKPVVDRPHSHGDRRALVLVRQRGEAGHGLDHRLGSVLEPDSAALRRLFCSCNS